MQITQTHASTKGAIIGRDKRETAHITQTHARTDGAILGRDKRETAQITQTQARTNAAIIGRHTQTLDDTETLRLTIIHKDKTAREEQAFLT